MTTDDQKMNEQEAFNYLMEYLKTLQTTGKKNDVDLDISDALVEYVKQYLHRAPKTPYEDDPFIKTNFSIFQDAASLLCRMGTIRLGVQGFAKNDKIIGHAYSLTTQGKEWLAKASDDFIYKAPSHFSELLARHDQLFGEGFEQRAQEACNTYLSGCYLASCVMSGAAAESIILELCTKKFPGENILATYESRNGTKKLFDKLTSNLRQELKAKFTSLNDLIKYRRDNASHGKYLTIKEFDAYDSLSRLIRLSNIIADNSNEITS